MTPFPSYTTFLYTPDKAAPGKSLSQSICWGPGYIGQGRIKLSLKPLHFQSLALQCKGHRASGRIPIFVASKKRLASIAKTFLSPAAVGESRRGQQCSAGGTAPARSSLGREWVIFSRNGFWIQNARERAGSPSWHKRSKLRAGALVQLQVLCSVWRFQGH